MLFGKHNHLHVRLFDTRELGALSLMLAILYFGDGMVNVFVPIYFWKLGFPLWKILGFYFLNAVYFLLFTGIFFPLLKRMSDKFMIALSVPLVIVYFLFINGIESYGWMYWIAPAILALHMLFLNVGYNLDFSCVTQKGREGHEVGMRYLTGDLAQFLAPLFGGVIIALFGFHTSFYAAILVFFISIIPLLFVKRRMVGEQINFKALVHSLANESSSFNISSIGCASEIMVAKIIWPIFIFLTLQSTEELGGVISLGLLLGALGTYLTGLFFDKGKAKNILVILSGIFSLVWISRIFVRGSNAIFGTHILGNIISSGLLVAWVSEYYARAHASENPTMFILSREIYFQAIRIFFLPVLIILSIIIPLEFFFPISFGIAAFMSILFAFAAKK